MNPGSELTNGNIVFLSEPSIATRNLPERCSRARVRFAAQHQRALAHCAPFRRIGGATDGSDGNTRETIIKYTSKRKGDLRLPLDKTYHGGPRTISISAPIVNSPTIYCPHTENDLTKALSEPEAMIARRLAVAVPSDRKILIVQNEVAILNVTLTCQ